MIESESGRADKFSRRAMLRTAGIAAGSLATAPAFNLLPTFAQEKPSTELTNSRPGGEPTLDSVWTDRQRTQKAP